LLSSLEEILDLVLDCLDFFPFIHAIDPCLPTLVLLRELSDFSGSVRSGNCS
jgi:hypothetical protein